MLDGRYPSQEFGDLRPRIVWDRVGGTIRARKGSRALAITNAGTIPDRGLFMVTLPDGRKVGELDEEMVYEARPGQTFLLGASTWRIEDIGRDRVTVTPAPGAPGAVPFWRGDSVGRPKELGQAIGAFSRWAVEQDAAVLEERYDLDALAAKNLLDFLREQQEATRVVPSDRTIVVERFRDEIGDWRLCILSPFGGRIHSAWALALSARIRDEYGLESDAIWSDDGIIVHLPDADEPPGAELVLIEPDELEDLVVGELGGSALFGARFRENAVAVAAHPARLPRQAHAAVAAAPEGADAARGRQALRRLPGDPRDVPRVPARRARPARPGRAAALAAPPRALARRGRDADRVAVRVVAALRLRRDVHVRGRHAERRAARGGAVPRPRPAARAARPGGAARPHRPRRARAGRGRPAAPLATARAPRRATRCTTCCAASATSPSPRCATASCPASTPRRCCATSRPTAARCSLRVAGEERWIAADDAGPVPRRGRRRAAERPARGVPRRRRRRARQARRPLGAHARPVHDRRAAAALPRRSVPPRSASSSAPATSCAASCARAAPSASGATPRCCAACAARRSPCCARRSRRSTSTRSPRSCRRGRASTATRPTGAGVDRLREVLVPLQGIALPADVWERDVLPRRTGAYSPTWMDQLCASGEVVWVGAGSLGRNSGRVALYFREDAAAARPAGRQGRAALDARARPAARAARSARRASSPTCSPSSTSRPRCSRRRCGTSSGRAR